MAAAIEPQIRKDVQRLRKALGPLPARVAKPYLIIVGGLPGTGKSYFSGRLARRVPAAILEADGLRKKLFGTPTYTQEESSRLFQALHILSSELLKEGIPVLVDATNLQERNREFLYAIADGAKAGLVIVWTKAPENLVFERLANRHREGSRAENSDADWEVYKRMKSSAEPIRRNYFVVDTSKDLEPVIDKVAHTIEKRQRD